MERRAFLGSLGAGALGGLGGLALAPRQSAAAAAAATGPVITTYVTGLSGGDNVPKTGEVVHLIADPSYGYDPNAVAVVTTNGARLGYLPPIHSQMLGPILAAGFTAIGRVRTSGSGAKPQVQVSAVLQPPVYV